MFKKLTLACASLVCLTAASDAPRFAGTVVAPVMLSQDGRSIAVSKLSFQCADDDLGSFDMCIDVIMSVNAPQTPIRMAVKINPEIQAKYKKVLMRYTVARLDGPGDLTPFKTVTFFDGNSQPLGMRTLTRGMGQVVKRVSEDGGVTYSQPVATVITQ